MKQLITTAVLLISITTFAQVGINNTSPKATLDITAKTSGTKPEGLIIPQLTGDQIRAATTATPTPVYGLNQKGLMIYATVADSAPAGATASITAPGYYYFDGSAWQKMTGAAAGDTTNDAWINDTTNGLVKLGTKADGTARTAGTDFVAKDNGQIGIGTSSPNASAALEVASTNKGMLIPRVALTGSTDQTTIASPATGLMVYNTGASTLTYKGFVFWNGTEWRQIDNTTTINPTISSLNCSSGSAFPLTFTSGTPYSGTLTIPYTGGNGGSYPAGTSFSQNGLTFILNQGTLNNGNGSITYSISGIPNFTSPNTINVPLSFLGQTCTSIIGSGGINLGETKYYKASINADVNGGGTTTAGNNINGWLSNYASDLPLIEGKLRLDAYFQSTSNLAPAGASVNPRIVNTSSSPLKIWFTALTNQARFNASNLLLAANGGWANLDDGLYYNLGFDDKLGISTPRTAVVTTDTHHEILTMDISFDNKWYRVYYFMYVDNHDTLSTADNTREIYISYVRLY